QALPVDVIAAPHWALDLYDAGRQGDDLVAGLCLDILDLAAIAVSVEGNDHDGDVRGSERVEQGGFAVGHVRSPHEKARRDGRAIGWKWIGKRMRGCRSRPADTSYSAAMACGSGSSES